MKDKILEQDVDDEADDELQGIEEEEVIEAEEKSKAKDNRQKSTQQPNQVKEVSETYEAFIYPARCGIVNTITGEVIEGFNTEKDQAIVNALKVILNRLDKIAIASGV